MPRSPRRRRSSLVTGTSTSSSAASGLVDQGALSNADGQPRIKVAGSSARRWTARSGAMMVRRFGGHVIRGSSTSTGALALKDYYQALGEGGRVAGDHA